MIETLTPALPAGELRRQSQLREINALTATIGHDLLAVDPLAIEATRATISEAVNRLIKLNWAIFLVGNEQDEDAALFLKRLMENEWQSQKTKRA